MKLLKNLKFVLLFAGIVAVSSCELREEPDMEGVCTGCSQQQGADVED
jgi:hypothetical protein